jgi:uncharacterized OsmC-like protein/predicted small metal-binding protein
MPTQLATVSVTSRLSDTTGRAIVTARGHHFVVDSPPTLGGPNEEINPLDVLLAALATCGTFVCETAAREQSIPLKRVAVTAAGDFDPRGVCGDPVDPRLQIFRVKIVLSGPNSAQAQALVNAFQSRCPVYTTLSRSAPIEVEVEVEPTEQSGKQVTGKLLVCRELGFDCAHEVRGSSVEDVLTQAAEHAKKVHNVEVTSDMIPTIVPLIRDTDTRA